MEEDMRSLGFQPVSSKNNMRGWNKKHLTARRTEPWKRAMRSLGFQPVISKNNMLSWNKKHLTARRNEP